VARSSAGLTLHLIALVFVALSAAAKVSKVWLGLGEFGFMGGIHRGDFGTPVKS